MVGMSINDEMVFRLLIKGFLYIIMNVFFMIIWCSFKIRIFCEFIDMDIYFWLILYVVNN